MRYGGVSLMFEIHGNAKNCIYYSHYLRTVFNLICYNNIKRCDKPAYNCSTKKYVFYLNKVLYRINSCHGFESLAFLPTRKKLNEVLKSSVSSLDLLNLSIRSSLKRWGIPFTHKLEFR